MLQDITFGTLDNQYRHHLPQGDDLAVCIQGNSILFCRDSDGRLQLPTVAQAEQWRGSWEQWLDEPYRYAFTMQERRYFLWFGRAGDVSDDNFFWLPAGGVREIDSKDVCFAAMTAWHIYSWYRNSRFCGQCGSPTAHDEKERMMRCTNCGNMHFPRIAPAVIIGLTHGDKLMLSKYANRGTTRYGMLAGFIEAGETAEEAVKREVMEEVGLKATNVRYYKSQPWGIAGNLSLGYYCDLEGDNDTVTLDETELACAQWFSREEIPYKDEGFSLTGEMIDLFQKGKEPR